jgi:hypothetical protein
VPGQGYQARGLHVVQVIQDARLMGTQLLAALRVADMPHMTSKENLRISIQEPPNCLFLHLIEENI